MRKRRGKTQRILEEGVYRIIKCKAIRSLSQSHFLNACHVSNTGQRHIVNNVLFSNDPLISISVRNGLWRAINCLQSLGTVGVMRERDGQRSQHLSATGLPRC